jgi:hypothetical protein
MCRIKPPWSTVFLFGLSLFLVPLIARGQVATQVFEEVKDSVFVVKALDSRGAEKALGSAVLLPSGKFATNYHVVLDGTLYQVGSGGKFVPATFFAGDPEKDICLLDAPGISGKPALLGTAATLKVGQPVYAVGAPQGLELSISEGIVSQLRGAPPPIIQTTAAISHGSSGGGLFDAEGRLVGLTTLYVEGGQNLNFALPVEWIADIKPGAKRSTTVRSQGEWWARATELEKKGDWAGMRDWCLAWTKSEPQNFNAWYNLGVALDKLQRYSDAIEALRQAVRINPEFAQAWHNLGYAYVHLKRPNDGINAFRQALRINPENADVWFNLGVAYLMVGDRGAALEVVKTLQKLDPARAEKLSGLIAAR